MSSVFGFSHFSRPSSIKPRIPKRLRQSIIKRPVFVDKIVERKTDVLKPIPLSVTQPKELHIEEQPGFILEQSSNHAADEIAEQEWIQLKAYLDDVKTKVNALMEQYNENLAKIIAVTKQMEDTANKCEQLDVRVCGLETWRSFEIKEKSDKDNVSFINKHKTAETPPEEIRERVIQNKLERIQTWKKVVPTPPLILSGRGMSQKQLLGEMT